MGEKERKIEMGLANEMYYIVGEEEFSANVVIFRFYRR
jgi:hypothetical protein